MTADERQRLRQLIHERKIQRLVEQGVCLFCLNTIDRPGGQKFCTDGHRKRYWQTVKREQYNRVRQQYRVRAREKAAA